MLKLRVYLDTSVLSALHDERSPQRRSETVAFWRRVGAFEAATSEITRREISQTPDLAFRQGMLGSLALIREFSLTSEMREVAGRYLEAGVFTGRMEDDALHVAAATVSRQEVLLSWNFRHLVNRTRRAAVNRVNDSLGLPTIEIIAPPEL